MQTALGADLNNVAKNFAALTQNVSFDRQIVLATGKQTYSTADIIRVEANFPRTSIL